MRCGAARFPSLPASWLDAGLAAVPTGRAGSRGGGARSRLQHGACLQGSWGCDAAWHTVRWRCWPPRRLPPLLCAVGLDVVLGPPREHRGRDRGRRPEQDLPSARLRDAEPQQVGIRER